MASRAPAVLAPLLGLSLLLAGCGQSAGAAGDDPVKVVQAYMTAVQAGNQNGGQSFLEQAPDYKIDGSTTASRYIAANRGATWKIVTVNWIAPQDTAAKPTQKECLIGQPPPSQICIVTVEVDSAGGKKVWFHFAVESRNGRPFEITAVDRVDTKPDDLLPAGTEAHSST